MEIDRYQSFDAEADPSLDLDQVAERFGTDLATGLDSDQVAERLQRFGPNLPPEARPVSAVRLFARQFRSLMVGLLALAAVVSFGLGETAQGFAVVAVLVINAVLGFVAELKATRSMEALRRLGRVKTRVIREGVAQVVAGETLVPGDVVLLAAGDRVAADLRLVEANRLEIDESLLTGESLPVAKTAASEADATTSAGAGFEAYMAYSGTSIARGSAKGVVTATGPQSQLGRIATLSLAAEDEQTPFERRIATLAGKLLRLTLLIALAIIVVGWLVGRSPAVVLEIGIALAIAAIPEGLPIVVTVALARGMWRMARRRALVRHLSAVETLGTVDVLLTDKTGTLTENRLTVRRVVVDADRPGYDSEDRLLADSDRSSSFAAAAVPDDRCGRHLIEAAVLANDASLAGAAESDADEGDPLDLALLRFARDQGVTRPELLARYPELGREPFDAMARMMSSTHRDGDGQRVAVKGAPEQVLAASSSVLKEGEPRPLDDPERSAWRQQIEALAGSGLRVLAIAERRIPSLAGGAQSEPIANPVHDLTLLGLVSFLDPARREVRGALAACRDAGVRVIMLTGDHAATAERIAREVGMITESKAVVIEGDRMSESGGGLGGSPQAVLDADVIARVNPAQKLELAAQFQARGHVVGMTGDGVNDAPALRQADVGIAMGQRGTEVAREAADIVLLDDAFDSIVVAISEGRVIFDNVRRVVRFLLGCNLAEVLVIAVAVVAGAPLPLLPLQILFLNLVTDVFPAFALALGEGGDDVLDRPPRPAGEAILGRRHWIELSVRGALMAGAVLAAFFGSLAWLGADGSKAVTVAFLTLGFSQVWMAVAMAPKTWDRWLWGSVVLCAVLLWGVVGIRPLAVVLGTVSVGAGGWALILVAGAAPALASRLARLER